MCNALKDGRAIIGLVLPALPVVFCSVAWPNITLEASLNLLWVLLALGAFVHWIASGDGGAMPTGVDSSA